MLANLENTWSLFFLFPIFSLLLWLFPSSEVLLTLFLSASHMRTFPFVSLVSSSSHSTLNAKTPRFSFLEHCYFYSVPHLPRLPRLPVLHTAVPDTLLMRRVCSPCLRVARRLVLGCPFFYDDPWLTLPLAISPCNTSLFDWATPGSCSWSSDRH